MIDKEELLSLYEKAVNEVSDVHRAMKKCEDELKSLYSNTDKRVEYSLCYTGLERVSYMFRSIQLQVEEYYVDGRSLDFLTEMLIKALATAEWFIARYYDCAINSEHIDRTDLVRCYFSFKRMQEDVEKRITCAGKA